MSESIFDGETIQGTPQLQMSPELAQAVRAHLEGLRAHYVQMDWAQRIGFGDRPAVVVIDLALFWTQPDQVMGSNIDVVVDATCRILQAARAADVPIFFSTFDYDPGQRAELFPRKALIRADLDPAVFELDPRLERRANEKIIRKSYASCFKGTHLHQMLAVLGVDTVIATGVSTSHCVYATCRDASESFRVIVPREAVGERCQIMHMVNLLDMDIDVGDVVPTDDVVANLETRGSASRR